MDIGKAFYEEVVCLKFQASFNNKQILTKLTDPKFINDYGLDVMNPKDSFLINSHFVLVFFVMACQVVENARQLENADLETSTIRTTSEYYNWALTEIALLDDKLTPDHHIKLMDLYTLSLDYFIPLVFPQAILDAILVHKLAEE